MEFMVIFTHLKGILNVTLLLSPIVHELQQIVRLLKNKKPVDNDGIPSEVHKFASERLLTMHVHLCT